MQEASFTWCNRICKTLEQVAFALQQKGIAFVTLREIMLSDVYDLLNLKERGKVPS